MRHSTTPSTPSHGSAPSDEPGTGDLLPSYDRLLRDIKDRVRRARVRAALSVNRELIELYWGIGQEILRRQSDEGWGAKVIDRLAADLRSEFPGMSGLSARNLWRMRAFAEAYDEPILPQAVAEIPWGHNVLILEKVKNGLLRLQYAQGCVSNGWSRTSLEQSIRTRWAERHGKVDSNFETTLPLHESDMVKDILKDPYNFEFLHAGTDAHERDIETGLITHIQHFLLELGAGFAFVGRQYPLALDGEDYYLDLLFYHLQLRRFVVIELKNGKFKPEYAGKMNFYLALVDDTLRHPDDSASIGFILCRDKSTVTVEYALRTVGAPIGVSAHQTGGSLPDDYRTSLPSVAQLEQEMASVCIDGAE